MDKTADNKPRAYWKILFSVRFWLLLLGGGLIIYAFNSGDDTALLGHRFRWGMYYILAGLVLWILIRLARIIFKPQYYNYEHNISDMKFADEDRADLSCRPYVSIVGINLKETVYYTIVVLVKLVVFISLAAFSWERYHYEPLPSYAQPEMILSHFAKPIEEIHKIAQEMKPDVFPEVSFEQKQLFKKYPHIESITIELDKSNSGWGIYSRKFSLGTKKYWYSGGYSPYDLNKMILITVEEADSKRRKIIYVPGVVKRPGLPDVKYYMYVDAVPYDKMEKI